ncbi:MAG: substrate-binding domain-containing protein [Vicinamibacterales bacterium]
MTSRLRRVAAIAVVVAALVCHVAAVAADEIRVATSGAFTAAYLELAAEFERRTGHRVVTAATSMGVGATSIPARLAAGEAIDLVIVAGDALDRLVADGQVRAGSRVDLARSAIGMAVRSGTPKPDISTVDALTRTLLAARSIAYSASVSGTYFSTELVQRLDIADQVLPRSRRIEGERVGAVVARGDAEIGVQQLSELYPIAGLEVVGPLPPEVQRVTVFAAGIGRAAATPEAAARLRDFLASGAAVAAIRRSGLDPVAAVRR